MPTSSARRMSHHRIKHSRTRRGYTLLEVFLVLVITGVLLAAIGAALNIHLRVSEVGRTEVEQAQLARALLRRIADDVRGAVPHIEPVASSAGSTADEIASAAASASSTGGSGASGGTGAGGTGSGGSSTGGQSSGGQSSGGASGGSGGSGTQTLQPLKTLSTLSTLKPQSASSSSNSSSSSSSGGSSSGGASSGAGGSGAESTTEPTEEETTTKPPGLYGDQYTLQIDVSRVPRAGAMPAAFDAPGDVKTVGYYLAPITGAVDANGAQLVGLYRQSFDKAVANYGATTGGAAATTEPQLLASEVSAIEFQYFDGTAWQPSWDSSSVGSLPRAVEILITFHPPASTTIMSIPSLTQPQTYRLTVAVPAAQSGASSASTDPDAATSSSSETSP